MARRSKQPKNARRSKGERSAATVQRQRQLFEGRPVADEDPYAAIEDDLRLPDRYSAKSDLDKGLVTIVDGFTGNRVTTSLNLFGEIRRVLAVLLQDPSAVSQGRSISAPTGERREPAALVAPAATPETAPDIAQREPERPTPPKAPEATTPVVEAPVEKPVPPPQPAATRTKPRKSAASSEKRPPLPPLGAHAPPRPPAAAEDTPPDETPPDETPPAWVPAPVAGVGFKLVRGKDPNGTWGYEVIVDGRGVAWISAVAENEWILHDPDNQRFERSKHRNRMGAMARCLVVVIPKASAPA